MRYKDELWEMRRQASEHRKRVFIIIVITVTVFTAVFLTATVSLCVDMFVPDQDGGNIVDANGGVDRKAPVVTLKSGDTTIYIKTGTNPTWRDYVVVSDASNTGKIISIDNSSVIIDVSGTYSVIYTATDESGNTKSYTFTVVVKDEIFSKDALMNKIASIVARSDFGANKSSSKKDQIKAIYAYVNNENNIRFEDMSNTPNINRDLWADEESWIEEASRTLDKREGDCYSYYSVSVAFFEYFGIEYRGIRRDDSKSDYSGTHFWCIVNTETKAKPQWYFYDATRLGGKFSDGTKNACLRTREELYSYVPSDSNQGYDAYDFYVFDESKYPTVSTVKIPR